MLECPIIGRVGLNVVGVFFSLVTALLYGLANVYNRKASKTIGGMEAIAITVTLNLVIFVPIGLAAKLISGTPWPSGITLLLFFISGLFSVFLGRWGLYICISLIGPSRASMIKNFSPVFTLFLAFLVFYQWPNVIPFLGICIILVGLWVLAQTANSNKLNKNTVTSWNRKEWNKGFILGLLVALVYAVSDVIRAVSVMEQPDFILGTVFSVLGGWVGLIITLIVKKKLIPIYSQYKLFLNKYLVLASIYAGLAQVTTFIAVSTLFVPYVSALIATAPLMTAICSKILSKDDESFGMFFWISMSLMVCGAMLISIFS